MPVSGSTYSYAHDSRQVGRDGCGGLPAARIWVSAAAVAVGWSQYVNKLLDNFFGHHLPQALSAAPWGETSPGIVNLPAVVLVGLCAVLLIRSASESAKVNTIMVLIKLSVLAMFSSSP